MTSTFSTALRLELMGTGDQTGTWGVTNNTNLGTLLEQSITGVLSVAQGDTTLTLSANNGASDQSRNAVLNFTGAMTAGRNVVVPTSNKLYLVKNSTTGGFSITVKTAAGTGVAIVSSSSQWVYCDGTNVVQGLSGTLATQAASAVAITGGTITGITDLAVADGGTGLSSGTSGGVLAYTASGTLASSGALTASALVLGGGAGAVPTALGSLGTTTTVLHGNAAGAPTFGAVSLTADVTGSLPIANGGTAGTTAATARTGLGLGTSAVLDTATAAQYRANTASKVLTTDQVWSAASYVTLTDAATIVFDLSTGVNFKVTLGGNRTLAYPTNSKNQSGSILILQDGTGSRTLAYAAFWFFPGGTKPVLSTAANSYDLLTYTVIDGTFTVGNLLKGLA